ncbi:hypothetical protein [Ulvibacterium sp.]|uniref:hypothetical protein n=1 Tax=Ulvibacterium sp. TaxID=2665914 RepID=UPI003BA8C4C0
MVGILYFSPLVAQQVKSPIPTEVAHASRAEKVYLQLDNTTYNTSQTIWFKAIVTDAIHHFPTTISNVLYVQLIDIGHQEIVDKKILKLKNGKADSFFQLFPDYSSGIYQIRAYTEWNRNFGEDFIFTKYINLFEFKDNKAPKNIIKNVKVTQVNDQTFRVQANVFPSQLDSLSNGKSILYVSWEGFKDSMALRTNRDGTAFLNHSAPTNVSMINYVLKTKNNEYSKSIVLDKERHKLDFFPEGGELVHGLKSVVGFKALNYMDEGKKVSGDIVDENENTIVEFTSNDLGMGKVVLVPDIAKRYFGRLKTKNGSVYKYPLPRTLKAGTVMTVAQDRSYLRIKLASNRFPNDSMFIQIRQRGEPVYLMRAKLKNGDFQHVFQKNILPDGISELTVYDKDGAPVCERLVYIKKPEGRLHISAKTKKMVYKQRDSVQIEIESSQNGRPETANLSIMVMDSSYFRETNVSPSTILSYFLLESELRGTIETPSYYFEEETTPDDLEVLLLTQGWRRYIYDEPSRPTYIQPEKSLRISGYVGGLRNKKHGKRALNLTMIVLGNQTEVRQTTLDSTGRFEFHINESYGDGRDIVFQTSNLAGKKKSVPVRLDKKRELEISYDVKKNIAPVDSILEGRMQKIISQVKASDPFEILPNTIELDEVTLSGYEITPKRQEMMDLHGLPELVVEDTELKKKVKNWTYGLYSLLLFNYASDLNVSRVGSNGGFFYANVHGAGFTYVLVDGIPVRISNYRLIQNIPVSEVKSVEIIKTATANRYFGEVFGNPTGLPPAYPAILAIYTYAGKGLFGVLTRTKGITRDIVPEFSTHREFYSPNHSNSSTFDWSIPDQRKLIHWQPDMDTDANGKATVHFYNADATGKMLIIIEGITQNGKIGYQELVYEVMEAETP